MELLNDWIGSSEGPITLWQMLLRAAIVFLVGVALMRLATPRVFSKATPIDIVLAMIIGSNLSRTLTGNASFLDVILATVFLVMLHAALARLACRWHWLATLVKGRPEILVSDGKVDDDVMRRAAVGRRDLEAAIRQHGGVSIEEVRLAVLERNGDIDVVFK